MKKTIVIGTSSPFDSGSGINTYTKELTKALLEENFNILYVCPHVKKLDWLDEVKNVKAVFFEPYSCPIEQTKMIKNAIVETQNIIGIINNDNIFLQSLAHLFSVPFISVIHLLNYTIYPAALVNKEYVDYFVTISNDMCSYFIRNTNIELYKVPLIFNGIKHSPFIEKANIDKGSTLSLIAGGEYSNRKGGDLLKKLLIKLSKSNIDFNFKWFGGVPNNVKDLFNGDSRFSFYKKLPRKEYMTYMKNGNIYLFPSREEGCPMSLIEAMSYGLVPIASDGIGAMDSIIQHGKNGYISSLKSWDVDTFKLIEFLSMEFPLMNKLSTDASISIRETFTSKNTAKDMLDLLSFPTIIRDETIDLQNTTFFIYNWHRLPMINNLPFIEKVKRGLLWRLGMIQKHSVLKK